MLKLYLFHSIEFIISLIIFCIIYWLFPKKLKNPLLLIASYIFYGSWDWRFLGLIFSSTSLAYISGLLIFKTEKPSHRRIYLIIFIALNLLILGFFKYFNFFVTNLANLLELIGLKASISTLSIILPIGISFYTFQIMTYVIDIYKKEISPTRNILDFCLFVSYFPQLIAGPIERASRLIPEIQKEKRFSECNLKEGTYLFIYGLFKKAVIANSVAQIAERIFSMASPSGSEVLLGIIAFSIQIYADFSAYSDMAKGMSHFFGINLSTNFNLPYLSKSPSEFWKRWHITLSNWVKDYIYLPLGGNKGVLFGILPLFIAWFLMGLWHGAAWTFIIWGIYWFVLIVIYKAIEVILPKNQSTILKNKTVRFITNLGRIIIMLLFIGYGWLIFRAENFSQAIGFTKSIFSGISISDLFLPSYYYLYAIIAFLFIYEVMQYYKNDTLFICKKGFYYQMAFYLVLFFMYVEIGAVFDVAFIYFQF